MMRKFSVPYNGHNPERYLEQLEKYKDNIDSFYFGLQGTFSSHYTNTIGTVEKQLVFQQNTYRFLENTKGKYKRFLTLNSCFYPESEFNQAVMVYNRLVPFYETFELDGVIVADFTLAKAIHQIIPQLEIQTSCNTYQFLTKTFDYWNKECGTTTFNPPREILRIPHLLKEAKATGYRLKCIINEPCLFGCPHQINHACYIAAGGVPVQLYCDRDNKDFTDIFKSNFVLPRHLKLFDDYVNVYKIAGRGKDTNEIAYILDAYVNERNDVDLMKILAHRTIKTWYKEIHIPVKMVPDKLLACECKECDTCEVCKKIIEKCCKESAK